MLNAQCLWLRRSSISETPVMKSIEPFIMLDLPKTTIEPEIKGGNDVILKFKIFSYRNMKLITMFLLEKKILE